MGSDFLGRALCEQGYESCPIPAQFVRPFVKSNKNDYRDAATIAEAVERENILFVPINTEDQLDLRALHRVRDRLVARRTSVINPIRAFLLERGISFRKGPASLHRQMPEILKNADEKPEHRHASSLGSRIGDRERRSFQKRTGGCCMAGTGAAAMVNRRQGETAGHQQTRQSVSAQDVHSWSAGCGLACQMRRMDSGAVDERIGCFQLDEVVTTPSSSAVNAGMARGAECDKVFLGVLAGVTAKVLVMDLKIRHCAARLTPPAITTQHALPQPLILHYIQPQGLRAK